MNVTNHIKKQRELVLKKEKIWKNAKPNNLEQLQETHTKINDLNYEMKINERNLLLEVDGSRDSNFYKQHLNLGLDIENPFQYLNHSSQSDDIKYFQWQEKHDVLNDPTRSERPVDFSGENIYKKLEKQLAEIMEQYN